MLQGHFDLFTLRGHPNFDLWLRVHQLLVTRPPDSISISKVESHQDITNNTNDEDAWCIVALTHASDEWQPANENRRLDQAFLATQFLHEISTSLFDFRNS